jgi:hypothetical protein
MDLVRSFSTQFIIFATCNSQEIAWEMDAAAAWRNKKASVWSKSAAKQAQLVDNVIARNLEEFAAYGRKVIGCEHKNREVRSFHLVHQTLYCIVAETEYALRPDCAIGVMIKFRMNCIRNSKGLSRRADENSWLQLLKLHWYPANPLRPHSTRPCSYKEVTRAPGQRVLPLIYQRARSGGWIVIFIGTGRPIGGVIDLFRP